MQILGFPSFPNPKIGLTLEKELWNCHGWIASELLKIFPTRNASLYSEYCTCCLAGILGHDAMEHQERICPV